MKRLLIIGVHSFIGKHFKKNYKKKFEIFGTTHKKNKLGKGIYYLNLNNPKVNFIQKKRFDYILICAGKNNLNYCENFYKTAYKINYIGLKKIINKAINEKIFLVFLSSNLVFSGKKKFYRVNDTPNPSSKYGKLKLKIEKYLIKKRKKLYSILRLTKVYSNDEGLIADWRKKIKKNKIIKLNSQIMISPVKIEFVLKNIVKVFFKKKSGIFHISGNKEFSLKDLLFKVIHPYDKIKMFKKNERWRNKNNSLRRKIP